MKRTLWAIPFLVLLLLGGWFGTRVHASYSYYLTPPLGSFIDWNQWIHTSGTLSDTSYYYSTGLGEGMAGNGVILASQYSSVSEGEIKLTLRNYGTDTTGHFKAFYFATDTTAWDETAGTYHMVDVTCGYDGAQAILKQRVSNVTTLLGHGGTGDYCFDGMTLRVVFRVIMDASYQSYLHEIVYLGNVMVIHATSLSQSQSGYTGFGSANLGTGSLISTFSLGAIDSYAPNAVPSYNLSLSPFYNHVDLQWTATSDDSNGTGVYDYEIWRNGSYMGSTTGTTFSDVSAVPNHDYTYTLKVADYHLNSASTTASQIHTQFISTNPPFPSATPEGRRVGVRPTGAYWGAGGEQIDVLSGNLNFTLPLINARARGNWSVGFSLNYNSQDWRYDSGTATNWNFNHDVGYGYGWRLMAGAITPRFSGSSINHYLFTDSTGAEYRLDHNSGNVWSSQESVYLHFDANTSTLYFRDGSFWAFDCVSAGNEPDAGVYITYDDLGYGNYPTPPTDVNEWDVSFASQSGNNLSRGNPVIITTPMGSATLAYDFGGNVVSSTNNGVTTSSTVPGTYNYSAPSQISVGGMTSGASYNSFLGLTNETSPTGSTLTVGYNAMGQPTTTTSPFGATTTTTYSLTTTPPYTQTSVNGRWTKTTMDGLGRTVKVEAGYSSTTESVVETEYDSCGCSPMGKLKRTSLPHGPSASPVWTTYSYDGIGRTTSVIAADGNSTTTYSYQGNAVTVTDPTGNWKKYTTDALGQLVQVNEPNPAGGADYVTTYSYDWFGHLIQVYMPRPTGNQTRTFNYGSPAGPQLLSATNPENGTVSYTYNSDHTPATRTDAKSQQEQYVYDSLKRVTQIKRGTVSGGTFTEDTCQRETYTYGTSGNAIGKITTIQFKGGYSSSTGVCDTTFTESYTYSQPGATLTKSLTVFRSGSTTLTATYTYDNEGRLTATQYPSYKSGSSWVAGPNLGNTFDSMGRLQKLTDLASSSDIISNTTYSPTGQMLTMTGANGTPSESRTYNSMGQLTDLTSGSAVHMQYTYSATQNNGKITSDTDVLSGETVAYTYDTLNRLASATSSVNPGWGQSYNYDGFGNLTATTVTKGTAPAFSVAYDASTNRRTSECADANGNINSSSSCTNGEVFDVQNRLVRNGGSTLVWAYSYAPGNKRIWRGNWSGGTQSVDEITFYSANGQKLVTYNATTWAYSGTFEYFGGKLIKNAGGYVNRDRLGSIGKFFPYGQERPSATTDGKEKFATYYRDSETGLDYAENRYHEPGSGRFRTPDSAKNGSNWYAYADGDPVNHNDPHGSFGCSLSWNDYLFYDGGCDIDGPEQCVVTTAGTICDERGVPWIISQVVWTVDVIGIITGNPSSPTVSCAAGFVATGGTHCEVPGPPEGPTHDPTCGEALNFQSGDRTPVGLLAITSYFENEVNGTPSNTQRSIWSAIDWTFENRANLSAAQAAAFYGAANVPASFQGIVTNPSGSQVWNNGNLKDGFATQLNSILSGSPSAPSCTGFGAAINIATGVVNGAIGNPVTGALQFASGGIVPGHGPGVVEVRVATFGNFTFYQPVSRQRPPGRRR